MIYPASRSQTITNDGFCIFSYINIWDTLSLPFDLVIELFACVIRKIENIKEIKSGRVIIMYVDDLMFYTYITNICPMLFSYTRI